MNDPYLDQCRYCHYLRPSLIIPYQHWVTPYTMPNPTSSNPTNGRQLFSSFQFSSDNFVIAAGGVLFRLAPPSDSSEEPSQSSSSTLPTATTTKPLSNPQPTHTSPTTSHASNVNNLQICILRHKRTGDFVLPKGRKDVSEPIERAAVRETFEETGYPCELLPCPMLTRAPNPDLYTGLKPHVEPASTEPITITFKALKDGSVKLIFWYLMRVVSNSASRVQGTQMPNEDFDPEWVDAREAVRKLTSLDHRNVAKLAVDLVENGLTMTDHRPVFNP